MERSIVITVKGVDEQQIYINRRLVKEKDLLNELDKEAVSWQGGGAVGIILQVDERVPSGYKTRISDILLSAKNKSTKYKVYDAGNPAGR